jgi:hypothetical protein
MGSAITRIVQLGHHYGYSTLLIGFMLRAMGVRSTGLASIDISEGAHKGHPALGRPRRPAAPRSS